MQPIKFGVVGIGGYGQRHVRKLEELEAAGKARLDATVVIDPENHPEKLAEFRERSVRVYDNLNELLQAGGVDFITLPVGIHHHVPLSISCLEAGFNVVCEKPLAATIQDADRLIETKNRTQKWMLIGYQAIYSPEIQSLKTQILEGRLGQIQSISIKGGWPRGDEYYQRNGWAGRLQLDDGNWVLDSPFNNALSHDVANALYLSGSEHHVAALPVTVQAELYRAREIETFDTGCIRVLTAEGVEIVIALSHVPRNRMEPTMLVTGSQGTGTWSRKEAYVTLENESQESLEGDPYTPFENAIDVIRGLAEPLCTPEIARAQTLCINGLHCSSPEITNFPPDSIEEHYDNQKDRYLVIKDLDELLERSFEERKLFSELGARWAIESQPFDLTGFTEFTG